jgi:sugar diacid utilization regulator
MTMEPKITETEQYMKMIDQKIAQKSKRGWIISSDKKRYRLARSHERKLLRLAWRELMFAK